MNKLTKITLLIAVILCIAGGVFFGAGIASNGLHFLAETDLDTMEPAKDGPGKKYEMKKTEIDHFSSIKGNLDYMDLRILPSNDSSCYLSYKIYGSAKKNPFEYQVKDGVLRLKESDSGQSFNIHVDFNFIFRLLLRTVNDADVFDYDNTAILYIPAETKLAAADITLEDGDLSIEQMNSDSMSLKLTYGDFTLKNVTATEGAITLEDGDLTIKNLRARSLITTQTYGDISIDDSSLTDASFQIDDGDISVDHTEFHGSSDFHLVYGDASFHLTSEQLNALNLQLSTSYGDITVPKHTGGNTIGYNDNDLTRYEKDGTNPDSTLTVNCEDGDITFR